MSDSLRPHGLQHTRPPCPLPTPGVYSNSCLSHRWCHPTISSSVVPFSSRLQSFPASGSFQMSQFFASGGQNIGVSASVLPMNIQDWFPLGWTGWISLQSERLSRLFSNTTVQRINSSAEAKQTYTLMLKMKLDWRGQVLPVCWFQIWTWHFFLPIFTCFLVSFWAEGSRESWAARQLLSSENPSALILFRILPVRLVAMEKGINSSGVVFPFECVSFCSWKLCCEPDLRV